MLQAADPFRCSYILERYKSSNNKGKKRYKRGNNSLSEVRLKVQMIKTHCVE